MHVMLTIGIWCGIWCGIWNLVWQEVPKLMYGFCTVQPVEGTLANEHYMYMQRYTVL